MELYAIHCAKLDSTVSAQSAGRTAPLVSEMMAHSVTSLKLMEEALVMLSGMKENATGTTRMLADVRSGAPSGIPSVKSTFIMLLAAYAHQIAHLAKPTLASHVPRNPMVEVLDIHLAVHLA